VAKTRRREKKGHVGEVCEICKMAMADESQIVKLISKEIGSTPHFAEFGEIGTVKDYEATGYSFVAKKGNEVVGVIMAQKIMDYGSYDVYVNNFAVESSMQGRGIGTQLMKHLISVAKQNGIDRIKLHTQKNLKAYDIYHHMGFEDQDDESVYLSKWLI
jgi:GNAT superfamily N-acetyltransferase